MHVTTWTGRSKSRPVMEMERIIAWSFVAIAHLLLAWLATRLSVVPRLVSSRSMELVFIQLPPPPSPIKSVARQQPSASGEPLAISVSSLPITDTAVHPESATGPARPLQVTTADDQWSNTPGPGRKNDGISFERNKLTTSFNPIRAGAPPRLRLRREFSPRDVLRAVSKELFWPPGYTDDPCVGLAKAVEVLSAGATAREHKLLADAALQQSRYCN